VVISKHFYEILNNASLYRSIFFIINIVLIIVLAIFPSFKALAIVGASFNLYYGLLVFIEARRVNSIKNMTHPDDRYLAEYLSFFKQPVRFITFYLVSILSYVALAIFFKCAIILSVGLGLAFPVFAYLFYRKDTKYLYDIKHHLKRSELYAKHE
jgi:hypothetical protein